MPVANNDGSTKKRRGRGNTRPTGYVPSWMKGRDGGGTKPNPRQRVTAGYFRGTNAAYDYGKAPVPTWFQPPSAPHVNAPYNPKEKSGYFNPRRTPTVPREYATHPQSRYYEPPPAVAYGGRVISPSPAARPAGRNAVRINGFGTDDRQLVQRNRPQPSGDYTPTSMPIIEREMDWLNQNANSPYLPPWLFEEDTTGPDWWGGYGGRGRGGRGGWGSGGSYMPACDTGLYQLNAYRLFKAVRCHARQRLGEI